MSSIQYENMIDYCIRVLQSLPDFTEDSFIKSRAGSESSFSDISSNGFSSPLPAPPGFDLLSRNKVHQNVINSNCRNNYHQLTSYNGNESLFRHPAKIIRDNPVKSARQRGIPVLECSFCKRNNERAEVYSTHILKDPATGIVICPILRKYNCPICLNGGGDLAHTRRYCPLNPDGPRTPLPSVLSSRINSAGRVIRNGRRRRR